MYRSKFQHLHIKEENSLNHFVFDVPITPFTHDGNFIACNAKYFAVPQIRGSFTILSHDAKGTKIGRDDPKIFASQENIVDITFSNHQFNLCATSSTDSFIKLWKFPMEFEEDVKEEIQVLGNHNRRVGIIKFHPTVKNVLVSTSNDKTIKIWDIQKGEDEITLQMKSIPLHFDFNRAGNYLVSSAKDKHIKIFDMRDSNPLKKNIKAVEMSQAFRVLYCRDQDKIISTGFTRDGMRIVKMWDIKKLGNGPLSSLELGESYGSLMPFYDHDLSLLYLAGKGEGIIQYFDLSQGTLHKINSFVGSVPQKGICMLPKLCLNTLDHEVARFYKMTRNKVLQLRVLYPKLTTVFQSDLFPDTDALTPPNEPNEFFEGEKLKRPKKVSLNPKLRPKGFGEQKITILRKKRIVQKEDKIVKYEKMNKVELINTIKILHEKISSLEEQLFYLGKKQSGDKMIKEFFQKKLQKVMRGDKSKNKSQLKSEMKQIDVKVYQIENEKLKREVTETELHFRKKIVSYKKEIKRLKDLNDLAKDKYNFDLKNQREKYAKRRNKQSHKSSNDDDDNDDDDDDIEMEESEEVKKLKEKIELYKKKIEELKNEKFGEDEKKRYTKMVTKLKNIVMSLKEKNKKITINYKRKIKKLISNSKNKNKSLLLHDNDDEDDTMNDSNNKSNEESEYQEKYEELYEEHKGITKMNDELENDNKEMFSKIKRLQHRGEKYKNHIKKYRQTFSKMKESFKNKADEFQDKTRKIVKKLKVEIADIKHEKSIIERAKSVLKGENERLFQQNKNLQRQFRSTMRRSKKTMKKLKSEFVMDDDGMKDQMINEMKLEIDRLRKLCKGNSNPSNISIKSTSPLKDENVNEKGLKIKMEKMKEKFKAQIEQVNETNRKLISNFKEKVMKDQKKLKEKNDILKKEIFRLRDKYEHEISKK